MSADYSIPASAEPYPHPWCMTSQDRAEESAAHRDEAHPIHVHFDEPGSVFGLWLLEFRDERTGGSSPPPMN